MKAFLILEDGTVFTGQSIGAQREVISEIVFNTSMTGYLEVLTDPSYAGQAVVMTYPLIGNYGICYEDMESDRPWPDAFIVRELSRIPSNFRSEDTIQNFLLKYDIPGISGIDTRALTRIVREYGVMNCKITSTLDNLDKDLEEIKQYKVVDAVESVTPKEVASFTAENPKYSVALWDFGAKSNIQRSLLKRGCNVTVFPASATAEEIAAINPDGIMLSNGPGDPAENVLIIKELKTLLESQIPIFGICLGHQLLALAAGAKSYKLKFGHRGANQPVKDENTGKIYITSQNHGYAIDESTLPKTAKAFMKNANDSSVEGIEYENAPAFSVQFHPEACAGPLDTSFLFNRFLSNINSK